MILGLGNDIIDIRRIEKALDRYGERFLARVFTATERAAQLREENGEASVDLTEMASSAPVEKPVAAPPVKETVAPAPKGVHSSTELLELVHGKAADAPLCFTCGTKMRPAGSCYVCEGCGSTSGCS